MQPQAKSNTELTGSRPIGTFNHSRHHTAYRVPHTETILDLHYGPLITPRYISTILALVHEELLEHVLDWEQDEELPDGQYDYTSEDMVEFSLYSASEAREYEYLTWHVLKNVVDGLVDLLVLQKRHRQVVFCVMEGPYHTFVGYGHLAQQGGYGDH